MNQAERMSELITEQDAATLDMAKTVIQQKVLAFIHQHKDHDPRHCPYADPEVVEAVFTSLALLTALVAAFNVERVAQGKEPFASFSLGAFRTGHGWDA